MVFPTTITPPHPSDPLIVLPLPAKLPLDPSASLPAIVDAFDTLAGPSSANPDGIPPAVLTAHLRRVTRDAYTLLNAARADAAEARAELDERDTVLRGVEYERNRIREEIERCMEYAPAYTATSLESKEDFLASAPEDVKSGLPDIESDEYDYAVIIAQLEQELKHIQAREQDVEVLTKDRDNLIKAKKEIKLKYATTETWLTDYGRSTMVLHSRLQEPLKLAAPVLSDLSRTAQAVEITVEASTPIVEDPPAVPETSSVGAEGDEDETMAEEDSGEGAKEEDDRREE